MILVSFIDIRFGDPALCLSMTSQSIVYGSAFGRILYHNFVTYQEEIICEFSEECTKGIYIARDSIIYAAVGDLYNLVAFIGGNTNNPVLAVSHDRQHTNDTCHDTQVLMHQDKVCLIHIPKDSSDELRLKSIIYITQISTETRIAYEIDPIPIYSVPLFYDGNRLLLLS